MSNVLGPAVLNGPAALQLVGVPVQGTLMMVKVFGECISGLEKPPIGVIPPQLAPARNAATLVTAPK